MATITYCELNNYTNLYYVMKKFNLDGLTYEQHLSQVKEWLECIACPDDLPADSWVVYDYKGIPTDFVGHYGIYKEYFDYQETVENSVLEPEVFEAAAYLGIPVDKAEVAYHGYFENDEELAYELLQSQYNREKVIQDYVHHDGHYFNKHYLPISKRG